MPARVCAQALGVADIIAEAAIVEPSAIVIMPEASSIDMLDPDDMDIPDMLCPLAIDMLDMVSPLDIDIEPMELSEPPEVATARTITRARMPSATTTTTIRPMVRFGEDLGAPLSCGDSSVGMKSS